MDIFWLCLGVILVFKLVFSKVIDNKHDVFLNEKPSKDTYITKIYNDNRQVHMHPASQPEENHLQD